MKNISITILAALWILAGLFGCRPMPSDGVPFYLRIDSTTVTTLDSQGVNTQRITDVWVETISTNLGVYELPAQFPVLEEGAVRMLISPGIYQSGQQGIRVIYPMYQPDTVVLQVNRAEIYTHVPNFRYKNGCRFPFKPEDFEFGNNFSGMDIAVDTNVLYGTRCGRLTVTAADSNKLGSQATKFTVPVGSEVWLEADYKTDVPFWIGYYASFGTAVSRVPVILITKKGGWNKIYLKLSESFGAAQADQYNLFFESLRPEGTEGGSTYIDNVKLIYL